MTSFGGPELTTHDPEEVAEGFTIEGPEKPHLGCEGTDCRCGAKDWFRVHCYGCGRTFEAIALDGPTTDCICDPAGAEYK